MIKANLGRIHLVGRYKMSGVGDKAEGPPRQTEIQTAGAKV